MGRLRGAGPNHWANESCREARRSWWRGAIDQRGAGRHSHIDGECFIYRNTNTYSDRNADADSDSNRDSKADTGGYAPACCDGTASQANAEACATRQYLRRPGQSVGL